MDAPSMSAPTAPDPTGATTHVGMLAVLITADGGIASVTLPADDIARSDALRALVCDTLQLGVLGLGNDYDMWFDPYARDVNTVATRVARTYGRDQHAQPGAALFLAAPAPDGTDRGLDRTSAALLTELAFHAAHEGPLRPEETDGHLHRALYG